MALTDPTTGNPLDTPCRQAPEAWFPPPGRFPDAIKQACNTCPARQACLDAALDREWGTSRDHRFGIWGGMSPTERYKLERTMR